ncbi:hypothetical protein BDV29DRAFT_158508 [Aspergillus leporis]|jgi:hypothetical protein|uniref:DUF7703 domain-containing protein n=1 Tax=Aspergillus leporis TaxID=41062 RepID=A0A5N5WXR3_9EURO|nr:hypothetical protein BDV29DRAFT_158508 [Aspergillus leporis]
MAGETGAISVSRPIAMVMAAFFGIACYNVLEILVSIFMTFKRHRGLYFWSMLVATLGILVHSIAVVLRFFGLAPNFPMCVLIVIGWYAMVTGQAVVLYSRLHLVVSDCARIRWVLYMIITSFCVLHVPVTILFFGSNLGLSNFVEPFNIYERIQLAGFSVQEIIISGLYIWEASRALKPIFDRNGRAGRNVMVHLILVNVLVIVLDASLLATEYTNNFEIQTTYKTVVYSVKLKMEFTVLNNLINLVTHNNSPIEPSPSITCHGSEPADNGGNQMSVKESPTTRSPLPTLLSESPSSASGAITAKTDTTVVGG